MKIAWRMRRKWARSHFLAAKLWELGIAPEILE